MSAKAYVVMCFNAELESGALSHLICWSCRDVMIILTIKPYLNLDMKCNTYLSHRLNPRTQPKSFSRSLKKMGTCCRLFLCELLGNSFHPDVIARAKSRLFWLCGFNVITARPIENLPLPSSAHITRTSPHSHCIAAAYVFVIIKHCSKFCWILSWHDFTRRECMQIQRKFSKENNRILKGGYCLFILKSTDFTFS